MLRKILMYPLAEFDGRMKGIDWSTIAKLPNAATGEQEIKWVPPETFVDTLPTVLADAPPLPGEEARYARSLTLYNEHHFFSPNEIESANNRPVP